MAADAEGNDIGAVGVPITGFAAVQLAGTPSFVDSEDGAAVPLHDRQRRQLPQPLTRRAARQRAPQQPRVHAARRRGRLEHVT